MSATQTPLTDTPEPQPYVTASISMNASIEINNNSQNGENENNTTINNISNSNNSNNMGLPERVNQSRNLRLSVTNTAAESYDYQTGAVSSGTRTQNIYHEYPAAPSNSSTNTNGTTTNTSTTTTRTTMSVSHETNTGITINTSNNNISFKKRSLTELRFSQTSLINEKNIRTEDDDSDKNNNNQDNESEISSNGNDKMRVLAKNININDSSINNNAETRKKRSSINNDTSSFDLDIEIDSDISSDERNKGGILAKVLYSIKRLLLQLERGKKRQTTIASGNGNRNNSGNSNGINNSGTALLQNVIQLKCISESMKVIIQPFVQVLIQCIQYIHQKQINYLIIQHEILWANGFVSSGLRQWLGEGLQEASKNLFPW